MRSLDILGVRVDDVTYDEAVALVENASLPSESIFLTRLDLLGLSAKTALGDGPALILVGQALSAQAEAVVHREAASVEAR